MMRSSQRSGRAAGSVQLASLPRTIAYLVFGLLASKARRTSPPNSPGEDAPGPPPSPPAPPPPRPRGPQDEPAELLGGVPALGQPVRVGLEPLQRLPVVRASVEALRGRPFGPDLGLHSPRPDDDHVDPVQQELPSQRI